MLQACDIGLIVSIFTGLGLVRGNVNDDQSFNLFFFFLAPVHPLSPDYTPLHSLSNDKKERKEHAIRDMDWLRLGSFCLHSPWYSPGWMADEGEHEGTCDSKLNKYNWMELSLLPHLRFSTATSPFFIFFKVQQLSLELGSFLPSLWELFFVYFWSKCECLCVCVWEVVKLKERSVCVCV